VGPIHLIIWRVSLFIFILIRHWGASQVQLFSLVCNEPFWLAHQHTQKRKMRSTDLHSNESLWKTSYLNALNTNCSSVTKSPHSFWAQNCLHRVCYGNCPDEQRLQSVNCRDKEAATINQDLQGSHYQRINTTTESYDLQESSQNTVELPCISAEQPYDMEVPLWPRKASFEWIHPELKPLINQFHVPLILHKFHYIQYAMILAKSDSNCTSKRGGTQLGTHLSLCSFKIACQSCSSICCKWRNRVWNAILGSSKYTTLITSLNF
jgi:hypothetical protein